MATIRFHVVPNAKQNNVMGEHGAAIKVKLRAAPVEGKANATLRSFLAKKLQIAECAVILEHGQRSRDKLIRVEGLSDEEVRRRLLGATVK